jgi:hypothetical protein
MYKANRKDRSYKEQVRPKARTLALTFASDFDETIYPSIKLLHK